MSQDRLSALLDALGEARLLRAQSLLAEGGVEVLSVEAGLLRARVGAGAQRYAVQLRVAPLEAGGLVARLARAPVLLGRLLLPGPLPEAVVPEVVPTRLHELAPTCSCAEAQAWCPHAVAVVLLVGERWSRDAEGLLRWRGVRRERLVEAVYPSDTSVGEGEAFWRVGGPLPRPRRGGGGPTLAEMPPLDIQGRSAQDVLGPAVERVQHFAAGLLKPDRT